MSGDNAATLRLGALKLIYEGGEPYDQINQTLSLLGKVLKAQGELREQFVNDLKKLAK